MAGSGGRFRWSEGWLTLGHVRGFEVRAHWLLLALVVAATLWGRPLLALTLVFLVMAHELGHAILVQRSGLAVLRIDLLGFGGRCVYQDQWATEWNRVVISWGGVLAQTLLLIPAFLCTRFVPLPGGWGGDLLGQVFFVLLPINLAIIVYNLLPVAPLDGHTAWRIVPMLPARFAAWRRARAERSAAAKRSSAVRRTGVVNRAKAKGLRVVERDDTH